MQKALGQAHRAFLSEEVPVGAVIVHQGKVIARGYNERETKQDPLAHAEHTAIARAAKKLGTWRLTDCTLYVTLEPCTMCAGAIVLSRIPRVVFGCFDPKAGACGSISNVLADIKLNHRPEVVSGVLEKECSQILKDFFKNIRKKTKKA